ncbi:MAG: hypothetical protein CMI54_07535 [Parcubacteria group bacterium]|nr:hypothetical protein [Parcubacteria group bacterium]|tara:strand:- start:8056 stop:9120 length:1065 start_codon:yes stop_codon:yes gene_type:complete
MAILLKRTIYTQSDVKVTPQGTASALANANWLHPAGGGAAAAIVNTVQNATMTLNIPRADVNVFGVQGVIARPQLEAETATLEFSFIPETKGSLALAATLTPTDMNALIQDAIAQTPDYAVAESAGIGKIKNGLMNSWTGEATVGALPTMTASFTGATSIGDNPANYTADKDGDAAGSYTSDNTVGGVVVSAAPVLVGAIVGSASVVTPKDIQLFTHTPAAGFGSLLDHSMEPDVDGVQGGDADDDIESCAQSASFSWDVPVETILCLGSDPVDAGIALGNPPGTASFTVEALHTQLVGAAKQHYLLDIGAYRMTLNNAEIDSRTHNLAVGDLHGTYNYVLGGTGDGFTVAVTP